MVRWQQPPRLPTCMCSAVPAAAGEPGDVCSCGHQHDSASGISSAHVALARDRDLRGCRLGQLGQEHPGMHQGPWQTPRCLQDGSGDWGWEHRGKVGSEVEGRPSAAVGGSGCTSVTTLSPLSPQLCRLCPGRLTTASALTWGRTAPGRQDRP